MSAAVRSMCFSFWPKICLIFLLVTDELRPLDSPIVLQRSIGKLPTATNRYRVEPLFNNLWWQLLAISYHCRCLFCLLNLPFICWPTFLFSSFNHLLVLSAQQQLLWRVQMYRYQTCQCQRKNEMAKAQRLTLAQAKNKPADIWTHSSSSLAYRRLPLPALQSPTTTVHFSIYFRHFSLKKWWWWKTITLQS